MRFTYDDYLKLTRLLVHKQYEFAFYGEENQYNKPVIMRHDVDFSLEKAVVLAEVEKRNQIKSTYFLQLSSDFYNLFSRSGYEHVEVILAMGHRIGLHFDEKRYDCSNEAEMVNAVEKEVELLRCVTGQAIDAVSMHRPSQLTLDSDYKFSGCINSYSDNYFNNYKYVSDSRMHWREDVFGIIANKANSKLHILTHPFWYSVDENDMKSKLTEFVKAATIQRYRNLNNNLKELGDILTEGDFI